MAMRSAAQWDASPALSTGKVAIARAGLIMDVGVNSQEQ
jgi:hypothetical protein